MTIFAEILLVIMIFCALFGDTTTPDDWYN